MVTNPDSESTNDIEDYAALRNLGLSRLSASCYSVLWNAPNSTAKQIGETLNAPYRSIQRCLNQLVDKGFIRRTYTAISPSKYQAIAVQTALLNLADWQRTAVTKLLAKQQISFYEAEIRKLKSK